jgi:hypothetical protein
MSTTPDPQIAVQCEAASGRMTDAPNMGEAPPMERRNAASRTTLLRRVVVEFEEMPALRLTAARACRLLGLREDICARVFTTLVDRAVLRRDRNGAYVLDGHRP